MFRIGNNSMFQAAEGNGIFALDMFGVVLHEYYDGMQRGTAGKDAP